MKPSRASETPGKNLRLVKTLRRLLAMARPYWWALAVSAALIFVGSALQGAAVPLCVGLTVLAADPLNAQLHGDQEKLGLLQRISDYLTHTVHITSPREIFLFFVALLFIVYFAKCVVNGFQLFLSQFFSQRVILALRGRLHAHLMRLPAAFFESRRTGDLMSRATSDVAVLQSVVNTDLVEALRAPITALASLTLMLKMSVSLTLVTFAVGPVVVLAIMRSSRKIRKITREVQRRLGQLNAHLQERLSSVRIVQLFTREDYEIARFNEINEKNIKANLRAVKVGALLYPGIEFVAFLGMMLALIVAGLQMLAGKFIISDLLVFLFAAQQAGTGLIKIGKIRLAMDQALAAGERVFEILDTESEVKEPAEPVHLAKVKGKIDFYKVSFRYRTGEEVLRDIELHIAPGEVVALVGKSGAGKTSLVNLIPRFYDPTSGHIEIDGIDIRRVGLQALRSQIGIVPQETFLFAGSVHENILYGRLEASREEVVAAAQAANADEFIRAMPGGYDALVAERGATLSGGQRQRIAIARALLKDPRILILDEPTSSLDVKSEELVLEALARLMVGRTCIVIAHRPSTIKNADRILVLAEGCIVEEGSHHRLINAGGPYSALYESYFSSLAKATETK